MRQKTSLLLLIVLSGAVITSVNYSKSMNTDYDLVKKEPIRLSSNDINFTKMMDVLTHQRCMNCHPNDHIPKQGEDSHPHYFNMHRGKDNHGFEATKCNTCHQPENNKYSGVPGAPHWGLAPATMGWQGLSHKEIAQSLVDKEKNGNRGYDDLIRHMTEDKLVLWAWEPGVDAEGNPREVPPVSKEEFAEAIKQWFADGAVIPEN